MPRGEAARAVNFSLLLYYITDRTQFAGNESARRRALLQKITEAARCGADFVQLREKDLSARGLENLACTAVEAVRANSPKTRLLINSRSDVAIACGADGVHLRAEDISPREVRDLWERAHKSSPPVIGVSCHSVADVARAAAEGASFAVFAPVFGKRDAPDVKPSGIEDLRVACRQGIPVLALGGVTLNNAAACMEAGAAGVAGIRLFQENDMAEAVRKLRG